MSLSWESWGRAASRIASANSAKRLFRFLLITGCGLGLAPPAFAGTAVIANGTRTAMVSLQMRSGHAPWQGNVLRDGPLGVQKQKVIFVSSDACVYDLKATFEDGHRVTRQHVNLCGPTFVLRDF